MTTREEKGRVNSTFFSFPKVIWNGFAYVDYIYVPSDFCGGIGSVFIHVLPGYTVFLDPDQKNESIGRESWGLQKLDTATGEWKPDDAVSNQIGTLMNSSGIYFSRETTFKSGSSSTVWYWLKPGSKLKILFAVNPASSGEYRLVWNLDGIYAVQIGDLDSTENVTAKTITRKDSCWVQFIGENRSKCFIDWSDTYSFNDATGEWETSFMELELASDSLTGCSSARLFFGSFSLDAGKWFCLDPSISTFNSNPTLDGYIQRYGTSYPPSPSGICYTGSGAMVVGQEARRISGTTNYYQWRSYVSFDTSSIPALSYNLSATLKLKTMRGTDMDFNISVMGGNQPIYKDALNTSAWDKGTLELARWDTQNYPGDGVYINITVPGIQINKVNKTQFELKSDREGIAPMLYTLESIQLYTGDSAGNEPKMEVLYYVDNPVIKGTTWFWRNITGNKAAIVLFGAVASSTYLHVRSIDLLNPRYPYPPEKTSEKICFLDALIGNGFAVLTPKNNTNKNYELGGGGFYYTEYNESSLWLEDATLWIMNQGYSSVFLFGFSGGGTVGAREIQMDYATRFSAAAVSCAPVNWSGYGLIYQSAMTAAKAKVPTCFPEGVDDPFYSQMALYNSTAIVDKQWHDWNGGHSFFPENCTQHAGENASSVVINWYNSALPPSAPYTPSGANIACANMSYSYSTGTFDANTGSIRYEFRWDDGTTSTSGWYSSGTNTSLSHMWSAAGTYNVSARAQDSTGLWSAWSPNLTVTVKAAVAAMKTLANGSFYVANVSTNLLKVHLLFNSSSIIGDQAGTQVSGFLFPFPDGTVNGSDISFLNGKMGLAEGQSGWDYMADIVPDRVIDIFDYMQISMNYGNSGTYVTDLAGVTITFDVGGDRSPDAYGFIEIPQGATTFTVKRNNTTIGAMIIFLAS
jgi:hypothetical protein